MARDLCVAGGEGWRRVEPGEDMVGQQVVLLHGASLDLNVDEPEAVTEASRAFIQAREARRVVLVTRGAVNAGRGAGVTPGPSALHGLARVVRLEHPDLDLRVLDLDPREADPMEALVREIVARDAPPLVALRRGQRLVPRRVPWRGRPNQAPAWRGAALVTGGLGAIGLQLARALVEQGARTLVLLGRSSPGPDARRVIDDMRRQGARVEVLQADVARHDELARGLASVEQPVTAAFHCAGVTGDALVEETDETLLRRVLAPKVAGAWNLHSLLGGDLDALVLFGSVGAWEGLPGQGAYAAANAFLDGLAEARRAAGMPAVCIGWCGWRDLGFAATEGGTPGAGHAPRAGRRESEPGRGPGHPGPDPGLVAAGEAGGDAAGAP